MAPSWSGRSWVTRPCTSRTRREVRGFARGKRVAPCHARIQGAGGAGTEVRGALKPSNLKSYKEELRKVRAHILDESKGSESWDSKDSEKSENNAEESKDKDISANVEHVEEQEDIGHLELT